MSGIKYTTDGVQERGVTSGYHSTARLGFNDHSKGAKNSDIAQLTKKDKANLLICIDGYASQFTIGMEVEKSQMYRGAVKQYALFAGFERDSSCGYEAVTHILPLIPKGVWRNKVYSMMHDAKKVIEDAYSPSDYRCGGHITVAVDGLDGDDIRKAVRKNMGVVYALFRKRLGNSYCNGNLLMTDSGSGRYQSVLVKRNVLEFRLVSRFQSVKQMMRRYELIYELLNFSINNPNGSHNAFLKKVTPIIKSMYGGDMEKVATIIDLAKGFRKYMISGKVNRKVIDFVDPMRRLNADVSYDRDLLTNGYRE